MTRYYGVDVGGTSIRIAEVNPETGEIIGGLEGIVKEPVKRFSTNNRILDFIAKHIPAGSNIGISAAGVVEEGDLVIRDPPNIPIKGVLTFPRDLKNFGVRYKVVATNDMRAASQATARYDERKGKKNVCTATYSSGFNGAVVRNLENVSVAEIGHQLYDRAGTLFCGCGERGHLEPYVSGNGAASMAKQYFSIRTKEKEHPILQNALDSYNEKAREEGRQAYERKDLEREEVYAVIVQSITAKEVYEAYRYFPTQEPQKSIMEIQKEAIAASFGKMVSAWNPLDAIVCMGSMTNDKDVIFEPAISFYKENIGRFQIKSLPAPEITITTLPEIGVQGAVAYFLSQRHINLR